MEKRKLLIKLEEISDWLESDLQQSTDDYEDFNSYQQLRNLIRELRTEDSP